MNLGARVPGPLGFSPVTSGSGGRLPGPLYERADSSGSPTQTTAAPSKKRGITVNPASKIDGPTWVRMLKNSPDLPNFIEDQVSWANDSLTIPDKFRVPTNTIHRAWLQDYQAAFAAGQWEVSTAQLEITAQGSSSSQQITQVLEPDLSQGESMARVTKHILTQIFTDFKTLALTFGETFEPFDQRLNTGASLNSNRGLFVVANRIKLTLGTTVQMGTINEPTMLASLIHEISVHAGRMSENLPNAHGDPTVESLTKEIEGEFENSNSPTASINVHQLIEEFYRTKPGSNR